MEYKVLADKRNKVFLGKIGMCLLGYVLLSLFFAVRNTEYRLLYLCLCGIGMGIVLLGICYRYLKKQDEIMEEAAAKITEYISGSKAARIPCDEEGEMYRLFHEVNSLVSILNAHAENEERSKRFMKDTISDISHQLKTPLAALNIYNGILQEEGKDIPEIREFTALSEQELDRIQTLVQNLLKIAKLDAGTMVMEKRLEKLGEMMEDIENHFAFQGEQEQKRLLLSGDKNIVLVCDRTWLVEAVSNVVKNALDHTKDGDTVSIEWSAFATVVQIVVRDNGSGIHPEDLPHIFKRFYRSRYSRDSQGLGLGLPLAKAIVEAHRGTIEVDSQLGGGTVFTMNFLIPTKL